MLNKTMMLSANGVNKKLITVTIKENANSVPNFSFVAEEGMTWAEWFKSDYYKNTSFPNGGRINVASDAASGLGDVAWLDSLQSDAEIGMPIPYRHYIDGYEWQLLDTIIKADTVDGGGDENGSHYRIACYSIGTVITLADGSTKRVEDLTYDDELLVWDFDKGCFTSTKALWITKPQVTDHYYRLCFSDGTELKLVGEDGKCHRLLNIENGEFTYGSYFHVGQHTFKDDKTTPYLVSIELVEEEVEFYNVATHYHMNCFANGILSSCGYNNIYPIKDMKFVKDERELIPFEAYIDVPKQFYDSLRLGEQDLSKRSIEKAKNYVGRMLKAMK